ncbi:MAG: HDOD domain-containing protein [Planctomycetes bacterium]|nr:HDOD domain-containing protein [Planctomycetota bacterium]
MGITRSITGFFGKSPLDEPAKIKSDTEKHGTTLLRPPSSGPLKKKEAWWALKPEVAARTHLFSGLDAEIAEKVTRRVHTGRIRSIKMPESIRVFFILLSRKDLTADFIAEVLNNAPDVPAEISSYIMTNAGASTGEAPKSSAEWKALLENCNLKETVHEIFTLQAKKLMTSPPHMDWFDTGALWDHSLATALATEHLATMFRFGNPLLAYATALFHDLGHRVVAWTMQAEIPDDYEPPIHLVRHLCNNLHEEAGMLVAKAWKLPEAMAQVIGNHHSENNSQDKLAALWAILQVADQSVLRCGHGEIEAPERKPLLECESTKYLHISDDNAESLLGPIPGLAISATI